MFDEYLKKVLYDAGVEILNKIGITSQMKYMKMGGDVGSKLSIRTGSLVRAVLGTGAGKIRDIQVTPIDATYTIGVNMDEDYKNLGGARLHELGGVRTVTQAMRRFFWYKWKSAGDEKWRFMSRTNRLIYPKREYLRPAVYDNVVFIRQLLTEKIGEYIRFTITRIIKGETKAGNLVQG